jgi:predicted nucleotidyltransferase
LRDVEVVARAANIDWFVAGATARDILLTHVHGIDPTRATADIDIGVCIDTWHSHEALRTELVATGRFEQRPNIAHQLDYSVPEAGKKMWLDIVPFGPVQDANGEIAWPPDQSIRMSVVGYVEALDAVIAVEVEQGLVIPVASLPAQAMLKILAWGDRHELSRKDATDFRTLLASYAAAGNMDRLYEENSDLLDQHGYDPDLAGAALLARDMAKLLTPEIRGRISVVLEPNNPSPLLLEHMLGSNAWLGIGSSTATEAAFHAFREALPA